MQKVSIMQPYLFPYLGYFQLISSADIFVIYDDTQLISRGWVNRNRILINGSGAFITFPLKKGDFQKNIKERYFSDDIGFHKEKILKAIYLSYARAPNFSEVFPLIRSIISFPEKNVALFIENSIRLLCKHLAIATPLVVSSQLGLGKELAGKERVIAILKGLHATVSINPIGGFYLYSCEEFLRHGIALRFLKTHDSPYRQFGEKFLPDLSIIDVLMFVRLAEIKERLHQYSLIGNHGPAQFDQQRRCQTPHMDKLSHTYTHTPGITGNSPGIKREIWKP